MCSLPPRAEWSIAVVGVLLSPALAFVATVIVAVLLSVLRPVCPRRLPCYPLARSPACGSAGFGLARVAGKTI
jgi:hypothetical protein